MTYRGRNAARRAYKLEQREKEIRTRAAEAAKEIARQLEDGIVKEYLAFHRPRIDPEALIPQRFEDSFDRSEYGVRYVTYLPAPSKELGPVYRVAIIPTPKSRFLDESIEPLRTALFRTVPYAMKCGANEVRWVGWEPIREGSETEAKTFPRMYKAFAFLQQAHRLFSETHFYNFAPLARGDVPSFRSNESDWYRKTIGEVLEIALLELAMWLGTVPAVQDTPTGLISFRP